MQFLDEHQVSSYILVSSVTAYFWDILIGLPSDYVLIKRGISLSTSLYLLSRILLAALQVALAIITFNSGVKVSCQQAIIAQYTLLSFIVCITSFLFFLRIRAVYFAKRWITIFFFLTWMGVLGSCVYTPFSTHGRQLFSGEPKRGDSPKAIIKFKSSTCEVENEGSSCLSCFISAVVFDTVIFLMLSWRILKYTVAETGGRTRFKYFIGRMHLPFFTERILRGSQRYYKITVVMFALTLSLTYTRHIPLTVRYALIMPYTVVMNVAACRAFRDLKLSALNQSDSYLSSVKSNLVFAAMDDESDTSMALSTVE